jgi:SAM-dependent methyltransferase
MKESGLKTACPVCNSTDIRDCIEISSAPIHCNVLWHNRREALEATAGEVRLVYCTACGHLFNASFDPNLMGYDEVYENSLHFSPQFQRYAESLARRLISRYRLESKTVVEVGCGKGEFLSLLCNLGAGRGIGFDRSYDDSNGNGKNGRLTFIKDFYSDRYKNYQADLVCCRHVLEHIQRPGEFIVAIKNTITDSEKTSIFFEVPNGLATLQDMAIWDIIYEHCSYFTSHSLKRVFTRHGFEVLNLESAFGGQFLCLEARIAPREPVDEAQKKDNLSELGSHVATFGERYRSKISEWRTRLKEMAARDCKAVVWGAGSKGVTFLNVLGVTEQIEFVVDLNPRKHGLHIARSGQRIVRPEFLREYRPEVVIIMNSIYDDEIKQTCKAMGLKAQFVQA